MKVCVIGLGYVGSVAAARLALSKHDVTAVDIERAKVDAFRRGEVPFSKNRSFLT